MKKNDKYNKILDAFQELLREKNIDTISVMEIAQRAGIAKGGIYYYFNSKDEILYGLIERNYETIIETAISLSEKKEISIFTRLSMLFKACKNARAEFKLNDEKDGAQLALLHHKYMSYVVSRLKKPLSDIIAQGIADGDVKFEDPNALAEIVLIVLTVKMDNTISPCSDEDMFKTFRGLIELLSKVTEAPQELLGFILS